MKFKEEFSCKILMLKLNGWNRNKITLLGTLTMKFS